MQLRSLRNAVLMGTIRLVGVLPLLTGCPAVEDLPAEFDVAFSATEKQSARRDVGPAEMANSTWAFFRAAETDQAGATVQKPVRQPATGPYGDLLGGGQLERPPVDEQIFRIEFGSQGQMINVRENRYFLPDIYGTEVRVGADWTSAALAGVEFRSASFGVKVGERIGLAVLVQVRLGNFKAADAVLYAWGTLAEQRIDGTFGYRIDFSQGVAAGLLSIVADQYPFYALRQ